MTLQQWLESLPQPIGPQTLPGGAIAVTASGRNEPCRTRLWNLDDYLVSSVAGPLVILLPR